MASDDDIELKVDAVNDGVSCLPSDDRLNDQVGDDQVGVDCWCTVYVRHCKAPRTQRTATLGVRELYL